MTGLEQLFDHMFWATFCSQKSRQSRSDTTFKFKPSATHEIEFALEHRPGRESSCRFGSRT